jgi:outer membrane protein OmpA-like peptidoglycan-associated protein
MKTSKMFNGMLLFTGVAVLVTMTLFTGCATKEYVGQQIAPVSDRVTQAETKIAKDEGQITQLDSRLTADEGKISAVEGNVSKTDAKAEKALAAFGNLKVERKLVLSDSDKEGATFAFRSHKLTDKSMKAIDSFISSIKSDTMSSANVVILVAGHTDDKGTESVNYQLGKSRADAVAQYLITEKKIDPMHIVAVSYGESAPTADNKTKDGRAQNRRVEIQVYREVISTNVSK